jgi:polyisoprenyl-teichoic acid--peptidoglycan teichoic acid transferase
MRKFRRLLRPVVLTLVLATAAFLVPNSAVQPTDVALVKIHTAEGVDAGPDMIWILAVGSDARPGQDMTRSRGDALQLVGLNTRTGAAAAIGIPRDSVVTVPGHGRDRVNAALYYGGPELLARAVGGLIGVQPDYVFVTRFPFFEDMVRDIGGITVNNPRAFSDPYLKPTGFKKGRIHLGGYEAMAFSRIRKSLAGGDFDRSANQQRTMRGIYNRIRSQADQPGFMERGIMTVMQHTQTNLPPAELFRLAQIVAQVDPRKISTCVVQGSIGSMGSASVVFPFVSQARRYGNAARDDATIKNC